MGRIITGLDLLDIIGFIGRKNKSYQAILLSDIEEILGKDTKEFSQIRKLILDGFNNYTRSVLRVIFGNDFEGNIK